MKKGVSHVAGEPYLLHVKEPVHVTENNVMYSQIPWKVGYRLRVVFQPNRTRVGFQLRVSSSADFQARVDATGHFLCEDELRDWTLTEEEKV